MLLANLAERLQLAADYIRPKLELKLLTCS